MLALAFVGLVHRWALVMLRDKLAAIMTPLIVLLNGGMGWCCCLKSRRRTRRICGACW